MCTFLQWNLKLTAIKYDPLLVDPQMNISLYLEMQ